MSTSKVQISLCVISTALAFGACHSAPENDEQRAQDSAWGFQRDSAAPARFLVQNGKGNLTETNAYYAQTVENFSAAATYTLATWQSQYLTGPTVAALYRNKTELGFWRDMTCTQTIRRGVGGCAVTNYKNETDKAQHQANLGTVAMNVSPDGFARFYVFLPNGTLSPSALLDSEGPKFAPRLCTVCHGGHPASPDTQPDLGSIFREFMPSQLQAQTGLSRPDAEAQWFALNQAIRTANESIRGEAEGAPAGVDHAKAAMSAVLDALYPDLAPPARSLTDAALTPVSWASDPKNTKLWTSLVAPYCMACHRHNADDWSVYGNFEYLQESASDGPTLRDYIGGGATSAHPQPFMPQSELQYNLLTADHAAQAAVNAWLPCQSGQACVPANPCHTGTATCQSGTVVCHDTGLTAPDGTACGDHGVCSRGACVVSGGTCDPEALILADGPGFDPDDDKLANAVSQAGFGVLKLASGSSTFDRPYTDNASSYGVIIVSPGRTSSSDMPAAGQAAIVAAAAAGTGIVFTEGTSVEVREHRYAQLASLVLLQSTGSRIVGRETFTLIATAHPIWTGLPTTFTSSKAMGYSVGDPINGGVSIASVGNEQSGLLVREGAAGNGRVVHVNHAAAFTPGWGDDAQMTLMFTNAVRWAAHCL
jgi:hypothetical protein